MGGTREPIEYLVTLCIGSTSARASPRLKSTNMPAPCSLPSDALLNAHRLRGAFTDCYAKSIDGSVSLDEFVFAFYTTPLFKLERWLLARVLGFASSDVQALQLARAEVEQFSAWTVEARSAGQILLAAGATRSWLSVEVQLSPPSTTCLRFGSAVLPTRQGGKLGWGFHALLGFHRLYSRLLLAAACRRVRALRRVRQLAS